MTQRRSLVTGLDKTTGVAELEKEFVFGANEASDASTGATTTQDDKPPVVATESKAVLPQFRGRVPLTTRCRPEIASALKRASLKRQLDGVEPNRIQDIIEEALESWLSLNGYAS